MALRSALPLLRCSRSVLHGQAAAFSRCNPALSDIQIKDKLDAGRALKVLIVQENKALFTNYFIRHLKWPEPSS